MVTIAKVIKRDQHGAPIALGKEHALAGDGELATLCGISYWGKNRDWYYTGDDPGPCVAALTGEVTCGCCLRMLRVKGETGAGE